MKKDYLVKKSNYFIMNSSYDLSLEEQKIILTLASTVQPQDEEFKPYKFRIADFMELLDIKDKSRYSEIPKITKGLMKKVFEIREGKTLIQTAWLSGAFYEEGSGEVELTFSSYLKPYLLQLKEQFTKYQLKNVLFMKSKYAPRLYEILKCNEFKQQGHVEIEIEELKKLLKIENKYPKYNDFKRKVIEQTQKELKEISDISFTFDEIKTGRKVTSLRFYINKNNIENKFILPSEEILPKEVEDNSSLEVKEVKNIISQYCNKNISNQTATAFYELAKSNKDYKDNPLVFIKELAEYSETQNIKNFNAWFKDMLKNYEKPLQSTKKLKFDNFKGRKYDYEELEKKLLGWD